MKTEFTHPEPAPGKNDWQAHAACRGLATEAFFHPFSEGRRSRRARIQAAKTICEPCPVIQACLAYALTTREPYGIWGGRSEEERALLLGVRTLRYPGKCPDLAPTQGLTPAMGPTQGSGNDGANHHRS